MKDTLTLKKIIHDKFCKMKLFLNERQIRLFAATEASSKVLPIVKTNFSLKRDPKPPLIFYHFVTTIKISKLLFMQKIKYKFKTISLPKYFG